MSQILVQFDPTLKHSEIITDSKHLTKSEMGDAKYQVSPNEMDIQQTSIVGIIAPLIEINNVVIDFNNIINFKLDCKSILPTISMTVVDSYGLLKILDDPCNDNELRIEILPPFDNAYKKINLDFFISSIKIAGNKIINLTGSYKLPYLTSSRIESLGEMSTIDFFEKIAKDSKLGFATNIKNEDRPKIKNDHFIYCDNKSYLSILCREIKYCGNKHQIFDWWVDYWNHIIYADIYERYNTIDKTEEMMIWAHPNHNQVTEGIETKPYKIEATITNHPLLANSELFVSNYRIVNNPGGGLYKGTDKLYSIYECNKNDQQDFLIQDGDIKKDIFTKYEYLGETYGEFNYLLMDKCRDAYLQKINSETVEVTLNSAVFSLVRGYKVNYNNYISNERLKNKLKELNDDKLIDTEQPTYTPTELTLTGEENERKLKSEANHTFILDKKISGQYLIIGSSIRYQNNKWETILTLARPADQKIKQIKDD